MVESREYQWAGKAIAKKLLIKKAVFSFLEKAYEKIARGSFRLLFFLHPSMYFGNVYSVFLAYASDADVRFHASSGGFCKSFLVFLLRHRIVEGAILTRSGSDNSPFEPETIITDKTEDIVSARTNSIYAPMTHPLRVVKGIDSGKKYAFVALIAMFAI